MDHEYLRGVPTPRHIIAISLAISFSIDAIRHHNVARPLRLSLGGLAGRPQCTLLGGSWLSECFIGLPSLAAW